MKKYFYFLLPLFIAASCTEDVKFSNPASFQTLKDNVFWKAQNYKAYLNEKGNLTIEGFSENEKVILKTVSSAKQTYILGVDEVSAAYYENTFPDEVSSFSTGTDIGNGQIIITNYDTENNTISGTFKFTAVNNDTSNVENSKINFAEGVFYKVPVEAGNL